MGSRLLGFARDMLIAALGRHRRRSRTRSSSPTNCPTCFAACSGKAHSTRPSCQSSPACLPPRGMRRPKTSPSRPMSVLAFWLLGLDGAGRDCSCPRSCTCWRRASRRSRGSSNLRSIWRASRFPYLILICLSALLSGVLNGLDHFAAAAAAPMLYNLSLYCSDVAVDPLRADGGPCAGLGRVHRRRGAAGAAGLGDPPGRHAAMTIPRPRLTPAMRILLRRMGPGLSRRVGHAAQPGGGRDRGQPAAAGRDLPAVLCRPGEPVAAGHDRGGGGHGAAAATVPSGARPRPPGSGHHAEPGAGVRPGLDHTGGRWR